MRSNDEVRFIGDVQRVRFEPGDLLVVSADREVTSAEVRRIRAQFRRFVPGHDVLVLSKGLRLSVMTDKG